MSFLGRVRQWFGGAEPPRVDATPLLLSGPELGVLESPAPERAKLAPYPLIDRYPTVLGANLSLQSISNVFREAQTGLRQRYVDVLDELLEREPHGFAVLSQRILSVSGGRLEFTVPDLPEDSPDLPRAEEIRDFVECCVKAIPDLEQSLTSLQWALYYGAGASEISWQRDGQYFRPTRLHFIHSRRIEWPDPNSWSVHIRDQGMVGGPGSHPTETFWGLRPEDYPGKFIIHLPQIRGDYPTRDGLGRELAYWMALKGMAARGGSQWIERFGKPWAFFSYTTTEDGKPRAASVEDIEIADAAAKGLGIGALAGGVLPDSVKLELQGPGVSTAGRKLAQRDWAEFCDLQMSKAVLWVTDTTEPGANGSRASTETRAEKSKLAIRYDADCLAASFHHGLTAWIVKLNFPGEERLTPKTSLHTEEKPDPMTVIELASKAAACGMPVDADDVAERVGLKLIDQDDPVKGEKPKPRRLAPLAPVNISQIDPSVEQLIPPAPALPPGVKPEDKLNGAAKANGKPEAKPAAKEADAKN